MPAKKPLLELMDRVATAESLVTVYDSALRCLHETLGVERASVLLFDDAGVMRFTAWTGLSERYRRTFDGHSPWKPGTRDAAPIIVPDVETCPDLAAYRAEFDRERIRALAFIPLRFGTKLLGKFMLYYQEPHEFVPDEITIVETIAGHIAYALEHHRIERELEARLETEQAARLHAEREAALREAHELDAEQARERLQILAEISDGLASSLDPDEALKRLAERIVSQLADYCVTYSWDGASIRRLGFAHRDPAKLPLVESLSEAGTLSIHDAAGAGAAIRTGADILVEEVTPQMVERNTTNARHRDIVRALEPLSTIVVPLRARGTTVGAIALVTTTDSGRRYGREDLEVAKALANRTALLVDNARLLARAQSAVRARDTMIAVVSHDLRSPLQSIATAAAVLDADPPPEQRSQSLRTIAVATAQADRLLQDLLDISLIDSGELSVETEVVGVVDLLAEARSLFQPLACRQSVELTTAADPELPPIRVDRNRILQVLSNLIGNALKFVPAGGRIRLAASGSDDQQVRIAVTDDGPGIDAESLGLVFDRFWRGPQRTEQGVGLGLAVAKGLIEAHGGTIGVESREGEGSTFYFMLEAAKPASDADAAAPSELSLS